MRLQVIRIADRGVPNQERLHLSVIQDATLASYVVLLSRYPTPTGVTSGNLPAFWFPTTLVRAGDQIVLFSGSGNASTVKNANGSTTYFFHWGLKSTVWNQSADCAVVIEAADWAASPQGG
jgi:hypothetical protein